MSSFNNNSNYHLSIFLLCVSQKNLMCLISDFYNNTFSSFLIPILQVRKLKIQIS